MEAVLYVDPSCPFAWITERWLSEVEQQRELDVTVRLLSLAVVNEHREIDPWYRGFNDAAWAPAPVMAAVVAGHGEAAGRRFYEAFGTRFHVELGTADGVDRVAVCRVALAATDLSAVLLAASGDHVWDEHLRTLTGEALAPVGLDVGVPVLLLDGVATSGPVLSAIPRGAAATELFDAVCTMSRLAAFVRFERQRVGSLQTG